MRWVAQAQWQHGPGTTGRTVPVAGVPCLITLVAPILYKDGKEYRFIQGPTWTQWRDHSILVCVGTYTDAGVHVTLPSESILSFVECSKVLKRDDILVLV